MEGITLCIWSLLLLSRGSRVCFLGERFFSLLKIIACLISPLCLGSFSILACWRWSSSFACRCGSLEVGSSWPGDCRRMRSFFHETVRLWVLEHTRQGTWLTSCWQFLQFFAFLWAWTNELYVLPSRSVLKFSCEDIWVEGTFYQDFRGSKRVLP